MNFPKKKDSKTKLFVLFDQVTKLKQEKTIVLIEHDYQLLQNIELL